MIKKYFVFLLFILLISGCSVKEYTLFQIDDKTKIETSASKKSIKESIEYEYKIMPKDRLDISVYNVYKQSGVSSNQVNNVNNTISNSLLDNKQGFLVSNKGIVFLPLIGEVRVSGLTAVQASKELTHKYKIYLRQPYVAVNILNQRVYILGEVRKPGMIPVLNETISIFEAISRSGDFTDYALRNEVKIVSGDLNNPKIRTIDLTSLSALKISNLILKPNDIVYISPRKMKGFNVGVKETLPLLQAISSALAPFVSIKYLTDN